MEVLCFRSWTERDATNWSSDKLKSLILGLTVESDEGSCEVTEVSKLEGEASINNRKGKLIFFYEWNLKATWTGKSKSGIKYKGTIEVPNLSDENDMEDLDISVSLNKDEPETPLTGLMRTKGAEKIREALGSYVGFLKTEFTQGMILPTANGMAKIQSTSQSKAKLDKTQVGDARCISHVHIALVLARLFSPHFGSCLTGADFVLEQHVCSEHYATIAMTFLDRSSETELKVECRGVPDNDEERTKEGWKKYYFEAIKQTFGYGARLF
ncbi:Activator of 90 kDa heat shock protein ATPase-like protein 1 [Larimichthys crocea]|uniref:Uncharacterized protein n=1 Tax=Larimichthys crocea TaxID=215358 RepID=A0ACD3RPT4_LARCR|nr:Activator of 90 kDa heat shock protein ATPase-like protein 1 [Larimichthys crocea]